MAKAFDLKLEKRKCHSLLHQVRRPSAREFVVALLYSFQMGPWRASLIQLRAICLWRAKDSHDSLRSAIFFCIRY